MITLLHSRHSFQGCVVKNSAPQRNDGKNHTIIKLLLIFNAFPSRQESNSKHSCPTWRLHLWFRERNAVTLFWCHICCCFGVKILKPFQRLAPPMFLTPHCRQKPNGFGSAVPWALLCQRIVCWWCHRCWPTWSDKSCSTWVAKVAPEASRPVSSAAEDNGFSFTCLNSNCNQRVMFSWIPVVTLKWPYNRCYKAKN